MIFSLSHVINGALYDGRRLPFYVYLDAWGDFLFLFSSILLFMSAVHLHRNSNLLDTTPFLYKITWLFYIFKTFFNGILVDIRITSAFWGIGKLIQ